MHLRTKKIPQAAAWAAVWAAWAAWISNPSLAFKEYERPSFGAAFFVPHSRHSRQGGNPFIRLHRCPNFGHILSMTIFFNLFTNLLPLYALIGAGFLYGRYLRIDIQTLINLVLYLFIPVVVFGFVARVEMQPAYVLLPILVFGISCAIGFSMLRLGRVIYGDSQANVLSMCTAMGNLGYFGLPLVLLLFEEKWVGVYMFMLIGGVLYEATAGYYIAARGAFTVRDSLIKVLKFPSIYALLAGMMVNYAGVALPEAFWTYWTYAKGGYVIIGMMIIGAALSKTPRLAISPRFLSLVFLGKFVLW
ncbi:MAG: AEC family transporter, partial [Alphaproteobacteria bacterium]